MELQKLTLEQVSHIYTYENDAVIASKWMDDLYKVMIKSHSHVGCSVHEIQTQKNEHLVFQETAKVNNYVNISSIFQDLLNLDNIQFNKSLLIQFTITMHYHF